MSGRTFPYVCRCDTTFTKTGDVDEEAFTEYLQRFLAPNIGVFVASSGSGLGQALSFEQLGRVYRTAVAVGKGKITVGANIPEQYVSRDSIAHAQLAVDSGVDVVNIHGPDGRHGFHPSDAEYFTYFDRILSEIKHPVALCPNPVLGYMPRESVLADICHKFHQVESIVLSMNIQTRCQDMYFINLKDILQREVDIYTAEIGSFNTLALGAVGLAGNEALVIPNTYRRYLDFFAAGKLAEASAEYLHIRRLFHYTEHWGSSPRWHLMFLRGMKLPGGDGVFPDPFLNPPESDYEPFTVGMLRLNLPEINEMALAAGRSLPD